MFLRRFFSRLGPRFGGLSRGLRPGLVRWEAWRPDRVRSDAGRRFAVNSRFACNGGHLARSRTAAWAIARARLRTAGAGKRDARPAQSRTGVASLRPAMHRAARAARPRALPAMQTPLPDGTAPSGAVPPRPQSPRGLACASFARWMVMKPSSI